jgi:uncharacterized membrane protein YuzA (DUF378 family)
VLKKAVLFIGVGSFGLGLLGFLSALMPAKADSAPMLFGLFSVDMAHVIVYLLTGLVALYWVKTAEQTTTFLRIAGVVYGVMAYVGVMQERGVVLSHFSASSADSMLAFVVAVLAVSLGYFDSKSK